MAKDYIINNKELMKDWNWEKNNSIQLFPDKLTIGSNKKAWWTCSNGHDWFAPIYRKNERNSCPFCSNRRILTGYNDLETLYPELMKEWDWVKNRDINPNTLSKNSTKKVFWICSKCGNSWNTTIRYRAIKKCGCPKCALITRAVNKHNYALKNGTCLTETKFLEDWNWEKNKIEPSNYTTGSNEYADWKCHICGYEWKSKISNRCLLNRGCPCCANKVIVSGINDLKTLRPEIAQEWNYSKNELKPEQVSIGSGKKVWWTCPNGHEYQATVLHRTFGEGTNCPICNFGRQTSFAEQCVYFYVKQLYPDAINRYKAPWLQRMELDIFIPSINYAIEYDGIAWHNKDKSLKREQKKYQLCKERNIRLIRIREKFSSLGSDVADYEFGGDKDLYKPESLGPVIENVLGKLNFKTFHNPIDVNIKRDTIKIKKYLKSNINNSFAELYPEIASEWDYEKNGTLKPNMFKPHSDHKAWWKCPICNYSYQATIGHRSYGTGCPICGIEKSKSAKTKRIVMIDLKTNQPIKEFTSISEAGRQMKISSSNISMVCKKERHSTGGYGWEYVVD